MFKLEGNVLKTETTSGTSKAGKDWTKTRIVVDTGNSEYPNPVPIDFFGDAPSVSQGQRVEVDFYVNGREYGGKYYVDISGKNVTVLGGQPAQPVATTQQEAAFANDTDDDLGLPF